MGLEPSSLAWGGSELKGGGSRCIRKAAFLSAPGLGCMPATEALRGISMVTGGIAMVESATTTVDEQRRQQVGGEGRGGEGRGGEGRGGEGRGGEGRGGDGTGRDGTGRDGTGRDGTGRDGTGRDGMGRDGTGREGRGGDGTGGSLEVSSNTNTYVGE